MSRSIVPVFQFGVTLIELVTTLVIAVVTAGLAAPNFTNFIQQVRIESAGNELHNAITLTRTEAISRNHIVDLVAQNGNWNNGWIIYGPDKKQIIAHESLHADFKIESSFSDGSPHVAYNGTGHSVRSNGNATQSGHIKLSLGTHSRIIIVNFLGRTRICDPARDKNCVTVSAD